MGASTNLLGPVFPTSLVREHPAVEFPRGCSSEPQRAAPAGKAIAWQLLRTWPDEGVHGEGQRGREFVFPRYERLCRRRPAAEYLGELPDRLSQSPDLWCRRKSQSSTLGTFVRVCELFLHGGLGLFPGDGRPVSGAVGDECADPTGRAFLGLARPAEHGADALPLPVPAAVLGCAWRRIWQRPAR